jgi:hypothetical protein
MIAEMSLNLEAARFKRFCLPSRHGVLVTICYFFIKRIFAPRFYVVLIY